MKLRRTGEITGTRGAAISVTQIRQEIDNENWGTGRSMDTKKGR